MAQKDKNSYINSDFDYAYIKKVTSKRNFETASYDVNPILTTLDSVFSKFEQLVLSSHTHYDLDPANVKIKNYLSRTYKKSLQGAIDVDDNAKVNDICHNISKVFTSKDLGYFKRKKQEFEFFYDLTSLIDQYKLCKPKLND